MTYLKEKQKKSLLIFLRKIDVNASPPPLNMKISPNFRNYLLHSLHSNHQTEKNLFSARFLLNFCFVSILPTARVLSHSIAFLYLHMCFNL
jgi:hypothetical protein